MKELTTRDSQVLWNADKAKHWNTVLNIIYSGDENSVFLVFDVVLG